ncbi:hypothetical protein FIBSPDRAFT_891416 [Athelia psychrophila]|uniref:Uncharacterized protein n=1 Tax=Athelia psychrophila TaxID=1759441 RepID=A0A166JMK4_9AGAM|nr:hypothetical protein FIBSPDRAFT_891416 [Fibularhizoctonia sp. CBS 109695]
MSSLQKCETCGQYFEPLYVDLVPLLRAAISDVAMQIVNTRPGPLPFPPADPPAAAQPITFGHLSAGLPPAAAAVAPARIRSTTPIIIDMQPNTPVLPAPSLDDSSSDGTPGREVSVPVKGCKRAHYSAMELEELVRITIEENPFGAKHGEKGATWKRVAQRLKALGYFRTSSAETIKHKLMSLIAYQEDPESHAGSKVACEMAGTCGIKIAALLDCISEMQNTAATQTEEQKECTQVKAEQDHIGGEAIHNASMRTLRRKRDDLTDSDSDVENKPPVGRQSKKACRSLSTTAQAGSSMGDLSDLKDILVEDGKKRDERQQEMVETLKESTRVYERTSEKYLAAILQLSKQQ